MQYLLLIYDYEYDETSTPAEIDAMMPAYEAFTKLVMDSGELSGSNALQGASTATTVRVRGDETLVTDGPFAETKEVLGGYYLVDCENLDRAIELASRIPDARHGCVEIRAILDFGAPPE